MVWIFNRTLSHMQMAQMRALAMGRNMLRVTNTGDTAIVAPYVKLGEGLIIFVLGLVFIRKINDK